MLQCFFCFYYVRYASCRWVLNNAASRVSAAKTQKDLVWVVKMAQKIVGTVLPNLDTVCASHLHKQASNIITDSTHTGHTLVCKQ